MTLCFSSLFPAEGDSLARITVMVDKPVPAQAEKKMPAYQQAVPAGTGDVRSQGYGPTRQRTFTSPNVTDPPAHYSSQLANFSFNNTHSNGEEGVGQQAITYPYQGGSSRQLTHPRNKIFSEPDESSMAACTSRSTSGHP